MRKPNEQIVREWAERHKRREEEIGVVLNEEAQAVVDYILEHTKPPTMADVEWDHDTHFLAEAEGKSGAKIAMLDIAGGSLHGVVTGPDESGFYQIGEYITDMISRRFTLTGRKYKLVPDEPEPLPEPEACKQDEWYLVSAGSRQKLDVATRRRDYSSAQWESLDDFYTDSEVTILARLTPDREVE